MAVSVERSKGLSFHLPRLILQTFKKYLFHTCRQIMGRVENEKAWKNYEGKFSQLQGISIRNMSINIGTGFMKFKIH